MVRYWEGRGGRGRAGRTGRIGKDRGIHRPLIFSAGRPSNTAKRAMEAMSQQKLYMYDPRSSARLVT